MCYKNGKIWAKMLKVYVINICFFIDPAKLGLTLTIMDGPLPNHIIIHYDQAFLH